MLAPAAHLSFVEFNPKEGVQKKVDLAAYQVVNPGLGHIKEGSSIVLGHVPFSGHFDQVRHQLKPHPRAGGLVGRFRQFIQLRPISSDHDTDGVLDSCRKTQLNHHLDSGYRREVVGPPRISLGSPTAKRSW
jgi:hypothetical protein